MSAAELLKQAWYSPLPGMWFTSTDTGRSFVVRGPDANCSAEVIKSYAITEFPAYILAHVKDPQVPSHLWWLKKREVAFCTLSLTTIDINMALLELQLKLMCADLNAILVDLHVETSVPRMHISVQYTQKSLIHHFLQSKPPSIDLYCEAILWLYKLKQANPKK